MFTNDILMCPVSSIHCQVVGICLFVYIITHIGCACLISVFYNNFSEMLNPLL